MQIAGTALIPKKAPNVSFTTSKGATYIGCHARQEGCVREHLEDPLWYERQSRQSTRCGGHENSRGELVATSTTGGQ